MRKRFRWQQFLPFLFRKEVFNIAAGAKRYFSTFAPVALYPGIFPDAAVESAPIMLQHILLNMLDWVKRHCQQLTLRRLAESLLLIVLVPATAILPTGSAKENYSYSPPVVVMPMMEEVAMPCRNFTSTISTSRQFARVTHAKMVRVMDSTPWLLVRVTTST